MMFIGHPKLAILISLEHPTNVLVQIAVHFVSISGSYLSHYWHL